MSRIAESQTTEHDLLWDDRLQDWLDDGKDAAHRSLHAQLEAHLASCPICQSQLAKLERLDAALKVAASPMSLDAAFDAHLFAQIDAQNHPMDDSGRSLARQRLEQEMHNNLQALSREWRRSLAYILPGVIAGIALALVVVGWSENSIGPQLAMRGAHEFGPQAIGYTQMLFTALVGAGIGSGIAKWLYTAAEST